MCRGVQSLDKRKIPLDGGLDKGIMSNTNPAEARIASKKQRETKMKRKEHDDRPASENVFGNRGVCGNMELYNWMRAQRKHKRPGRSEPKSSYSAETGLRGCV